jgi:hypothetical protein
MHLAVGRIGVDEYSDETRSIEAVRAQAQALAALFVPLCLSLQLAAELLQTR